MESPPSVAPDWAKNQKADITELVKNDDLGTFSNDVIPPGKYCCLKF